MLIIGCFSVLTYLSLVVHARRLNQLIKNSHEQTMKTNHLFPSIRFQRPLCFLSSMVFILTPPLVAQSPVLKDATVEKIATGFQFTEGPCWRTAGYLVFSDIQGKVKIFIPFVAGWRALEKHQVIIGAGMEFIFGKLNYIIFNIHSAQRIEVYRFNLAEALSITERSLKWVSAVVARYNRVL